MRTDERICVALSLGVAVILPLTAVITTRWETLVALPLVHGLLWVVPWLTSASAFVVLRRKLRQENPHWIWILLSVVLALYVIGLALQLAANTQYMEQPGLRRWLFGI